MGQIFHLNSIPRVRGSLEKTDSTAHAISRIECGFVVEMFKPFVRTASSESVRTCLERLRINVLESETGVDKTFILLMNKQGELTNTGTNRFLLIKYTVT
jgi:hypothetical protein